MQRPYGREKFGPAIEQLSKVAANIEVQIIFGLPTDTHSLADGSISDETLAAVIQSVVPSSTRTKANGT